MMGGCVGLGANQTGCLLFEEGENPRALHLLANDNFAIRINPVNLENRLRNIKADGSDRFHE